MSEEIWKPVPSLPGVRASSWGRIWFPERKAKTPNGGIRKYSTKPRSGVVHLPSCGGTHTYLKAWNKFFGNVAVHRAVCEAFHGAPPFAKAVVLHLDENAHNNVPENLRWGTQKENMNMPKLKEYHRSRTGENSPWAIHKSRKGEKI
jgi:hypothetical protein